MTDRLFTQKEINIITNKVFSQYHTLFQADRMSFNEWLLAKNIITEIQVHIEDYDGDVE